MAKMVDVHLHNFQLFSKLQNCSSHILPSRKCHGQLHQLHFLVERTLILVKVINLGNIINGILARTSS